MALRCAQLVHVIDWPQTEQLIIKNRLNYAKKIVKLVYAVFMPLKRPFEHLVLDGHCRSHTEQASQLHSETHCGGAVFGLSPTPHT